MRTRLMLKPVALLKNTSLLAVPFLLIAAQGGMEADPVTVTESVSRQGTAFFYDYAVTNHSSADPYQILLSVALALPAGNATIVSGNVTAPNGNEAVWDPTSGHLDLVSGDLAGFPLNTRVDGFSFVSPLQLGEVAYTATYFDSSQNPQIISGVTASPSAVPEPGSFALLGTALLGLMAGGYRLRSTHRK